MRRRLLITLWIVLAFVAWLALVGGSLWGLTRYDRSLATSILRSVPERAAFAIIFYGLFGVGSLAVMTIFASLGLRGKLPGTRSRQMSPPAFPVARRAASTSETEDS